MANPTYPNSRPTPTALDLALMPDYEREFSLRYMDAPPSLEAINNAWLDFHGEPSETRIYFVQRGVDGPIKIGTARSPKRRIAELQTACAEILVPLAICPGGKKMERQYHERFARHRIAGEWFNPDVEIWQEIDRLIEHRWGRASASNLAGRRKEKPISGDGKPSDRQILADLLRVKATFQARAIRAVLTGGPAS
jgi:hypothetical protein